MKWMNEWISLLQYYFLKGFEWVKGDCEFRGACVVSWVTHALWLIKKAIIALSWRRKYFNSNSNAEKHKNIIKCLQSASQLVLVVLVNKKMIHHSGSPSHLGSWTTRENNACDVLRILHYQLSNMMQYNSTTGA